MEEMKVHAEELNDADIEKVAGGKIPGNSDTPLTDFVESLRESMREARKKRWSYDKWYTNKSQELKKAKRPKREIEFMRDNYDQLWMEWLLL